MQVTHTKPLFSHVLACFIVLALLLPGFESSSLQHVGFTEDLSTYNLGCRKGHKTPNSDFEIHHQSCTNLQCSLRKKSIDIKYNALECLLFI